MTTKKKTDTGKIAAVGALAVAVGVGIYGWLRGRDEEPEPGVEWAEMQVITDIATLIPVPEVRWSEQQVIGPLTIIPTSEVKWSEQHVVGPFTIIPTSEVKWSEQHVIGPFTVISSIMPTTTGFQIHLMSGNYPTAEYWYADIDDRLYGWNLGVTDPWIGKWDMGPAGYNGVLTVELYPAELRYMPIKRFVTDVTIRNGHVYEFYTDHRRLVEVGTI